MNGLVSFYFALKKTVYDRAYNPRLIEVGTHQRRLDGAPVALHVDLEVVHSILSGGNRLGADLVPEKNRKKINYCTLPIFLS